RAHHDSKRVLSLRVAQPENRTALLSGGHIGLVGFEPTASWRRTRRDTQIRYSPKSILTLGVRGRCATYFAYFSADSKEIESVVRGLVFETIEVLRTLNQLVPFHFR